METMVAFKVKVTVNILLSGLSLFTKNRLKALSGNSTNQAVG